MGQQRTWDHIPERNCMWDIDKSSEAGARQTANASFFSVEMRNTCQVTNQSSHGELSFHHNPQLRPSWGLCLSTSRVIRREGTRLKNAAHLTYCHCCELCAIKQKPGVLLEKLHNNQNKAFYPNPNCRPYSSPHQVPKHKMLWYIEKGTLREVGKIDA